VKQDRVRISDEVGEEVEGSLPAKQEAALSAVLSHPTLKEAALAAGISESTLWRYMQDAEFSRRLREARRDSVTHAVTRLQKASSEAVTALLDLMTKQDTPAATRLSAIRTILDYSLKAVEQDDLRARLEELEQFIIRKQEEDALDRGRKVASDEDEV
jgi:hypothetical protein